MKQVEATVKHHRSAVDVVAPGDASALTVLDGAMLGMVLLLLALNVVSAALRAGWITAAVTDVIASAYLLLLLTPAPWRPLIGRLALFGFVAGVLELATDSAGEGFAHSLAYPAGGPFLWASPVYMPLSWLLVLTPLGYLAWRVGGLLPLRLGVPLCALWAGLNIPFYEEMAYHAGWWRYAAAPGLGHTPYYVLLFEALIGASLPILLRSVERKPWRAIVWRGIAEGAWMPVAALVSWLLLGR